MDVSSSARQHHAPRARRPGTRLAWIGQGFLLLIATVALLILGRDFLRNPALFIQIIISGLQLGFVYALIALGYTMVYGIVKLINFAHGDVFMVGSFVSFYAVTRFQLHIWPAAVFPGLPRGWVVVIGSTTVVLLSMLACALLAVTIERVAYKPLRDAPRIAALITSIGVSFFLEFYGALNFVFSPRFIPYQRPFDVVTWYFKDGFHLVQPSQAPPDNSITFSNIFLLIIAASILVQLLLQFLVRHTKMGKAMRAASFDKPTARLMGINVDRVISFTFAVGAAFAGLGGVLYAIAYSLHLDPARHPARPQGLRGRRPGRNRQHPRRLRGCAHHGPGRGPDHGLHLHAHAGRRRLHHPDPRPPGAPDWYLRRAGEGKGVGGRRT